MKILERIFAALFGIIAATSLLVKFAISCFKSIFQ